MTIDPATCPLCGEANRCAMADGARGGPPCWCTRATFDAALLRSLPPDARGTACLCARCAAGVAVADAASDPAGLS